MMASEGTFFSMEQSAKLHPCWCVRLHSSASIHSDLPELGTPVMIVSSPGTICGGHTSASEHRIQPDSACTARIYHRHAIGLQL